MAQDRWFELQATTKISLMESSIRDIFIFLEIELGLGTRWYTLQKTITFAYIPKPEKREHTLQKLMTWSYIPNIYIYIYIYMAHLPIKNDDFRSKLLKSLNDHLYSFVPLYPSYIPIYSSYISIVSLHRIADPSKRSCCPWLSRTNAGWSPPETRWHRPLTYGTS